MNNLFTFVIFIRWDFAKQIVGCRLYTVSVQSPLAKIRGSPLSKWRARILYFVTWGHSAATRTPASTSVFPSWIKAQFEYEWLAHWIEQTQKTKYLYWFSLKMLNTKQLLKYILEFCILLATKFYILELSISQQIAPFYELS